MLLYKFISNAEKDYNKVSEMISNNKDLLNVNGPGGNKPIHAACMIGNRQLINLFLKYDKDSLNMVNGNLINGYMILAVINPELLIYYLKKYPPKNIHHKDYKGRTILTNYIIFNSFNEEILKKLKLFGCSLVSPPDVNSLTFFLEKSCNLIKRLSKIFEINPNILHFFTPISFVTLKNDDLECLKNLIDLGLDINLEDDKNNIISLSIKERKIDFLKFFLTQNINYEFTDSFEHTYFHLFLLDDFYDNHIKLVKEYAEKINLNHKDVMGFTCVHLIFETKKYNLYKSILENAKININIRNKNGKKPLDYLSKDEKLKVKKELKNNIIKMKEDEDDLSIIKNKVPIFTTFKGWFHTVLSSIHYLLHKHKNLGFPICVNADGKNMSDTQYFNKVLNYEFSKETICLTCGRLFYANEDNYYINKNLKNCIKNVINKDYIMFYLVIKLDQITHANVILVDNKNREIERFEPMGSHFTKSYDETVLDSKFSQILKNIMFEVTNVKYTYNSPIDFQNIYDFQNISGEEFFSYEGETLGFCAAWIIWYVDHKMLNQNVKSIKLIDKLKNRLKSENISILDNIRGYAEMLQKYKFDLYQKYNLDKKKFYRIQLDKDLRNEFYKNLLIDFRNYQKN